MQLCDAEYAMPYFAVMRDSAMRAIMRYFAIMRCHAKLRCYAMPFLLCLCYADFTMLGNYAMQCSAVQCLQFMRCYANCAILCEVMQVMQCYAILCDALQL